MALPPSSGDGSQVSFGWTRWSATGIPWVATPPQEKATLTIGSAASFEVIVASNYDFASQVGFQWLHDGEAIADGPGRSGTGLPQLRIESVVASDAGVYQCIVSNSCGSSTSDGGRLMVCVADFDGSGER